MTRDEAKVILQAHRDLSDPGEDPRLDEALALLETDSELANWFENEMAFDNAFSDILSEVAPPPGLKERILALEPSTGQTPIPFPAQNRAWWQNPKFISVAASVLLVFTFGALVFDPQPLKADLDIPDFYDEVADQCRNPKALDEHSDSLEHLRSFLASRGAPIPGDMPEDIDPLVEVGATSYHWHDSHVSVVTMRDGHDYILFVIDLKDFGDDDVPPAAREIHQKNDVSLISWSDGYYLYVLGSKGPIDAYLHQ